MPEVSPFLLGHLETQTFPLRRLRVETFRELAKFLKGLGGKKKTGLRQGQGFLHRTPV